MIFRLQLNVEVDTETKQTRVLDQHVVEGMPHACPHCGNPVPLHLTYCNRDCFKAHGKRPRRKMAVLTDATTLDVPQRAAPAPERVEPRAVPPPQQDFSTFSCFPGGPPCAQS